MEGRTEFEQFEERAFEAVRKAEERALEAWRNWASAVGGMVPVEMPVLRQVVKETLDFTEKVLKLQREFVADIVHAMREESKRPTPKRPAASATHAPRPTAKPERRAS